MCMDIPVHMIFDALNHDGLERVFPIPDISLSCRGFHITEMIYVAHLFGFSVVELPKSLGVSSGDYVHEIPLPYNLIKWLNEGYCVMEVGRHAVAWDPQSQRIYCPSGKITACSIRDVIKKHDNFYFVIGRWLWLSKFYYIIVIVVERSNTKL